jgi:hypothetical protein
VIAVLSGFKSKLVNLLAKNLKPILGRFKGNLEGVQKISKGESVGNKIKIDEAEALKLYQTGLNDADMAKKLEVSTCTVSNWRKRNSLRANYLISKKPKKPETMSKLIQDSVMSRKVGMSYGVWKANGG